MKDEQEPRACRHLRSKAYYMDLPAHASGMDTGAKPCWCFRTQQVLGPDGQPARVRDCAEQRRCFEAPDW